MWWSLKQQSPYKTTVVLELLKKAEATASKKEGKTEEGDDLDGLAELRKAIEVIEARKLEVPDMVYKKIDDLEQRIAAY
jgi:hypothetical protein